MKTDAAIFEKEIIEGSTSGERCDDARSRCWPTSGRCPASRRPPAEVAPQKETFVADILGRDGKRRREDEHRPRRRSRSADLTQTRAPRPAHDAVRRVAANGLR